jgi:hypothetical protein
MNRILRLGLPALALLAAAVALPGQGGVPLVPQWKHWRFSAPVSVPAPNASGLAAFKIPAAVSAESKSDWADLRVTDAAGGEVPYVLHARTGNYTTEWRSGRMFDVSFKPGESTQAVLDLGTQPPEHNSLVVDTDQSMFFTHAEVAVSTNNADWRILRDRVPIYRFANEGLDGNQTVHYFPSRARYVRVRVLTADKEFPIRGVRVAQETIVEAERTPFEAIFRSDPAAPATMNWWVTDLGHNRDPVSEVRFTVTQPEFHRAVRISVSQRPGDAGSWRPAGEGEIYRYRRGKETYEKFNIRLGETYGRNWRVEIYNRNDPPLAGLQVALYGTPRRVVFASKPGAAYRVVFGSREARSPGYEMARLTESRALEAAAPALVGDRAPNPNYEDPHPPAWSERNRYLLWFIMLVAAAALGVLAVRSLKA